MIKEIIILLNFVYKLFVFDFFSKNINRDKLCLDHNLVIYYIKHF